MDFHREARIGLPEAAFCEGKSTAQIRVILQQHQERNQPCLLTRLATEKAEALTDQYGEALNFDPVSRTAFYLRTLKPGGDLSVAVVSGGTSDAPVTMEAARTLNFHGVSANLYQDVGVTGLWRLTTRIEEIRSHSVIIVVAGMEGALFSVLAGLVSSVIVAVPTSVGYGVSEGGPLALHAALSSCAPSVVAVNIDNGYGAACAALRHLNQLHGLHVQRATQST